MRTLADDDLHCSQTSVSSTSALSSPLWGVSTQTRRACSTEWRSVPFRAAAWWGPTWSSARKHPQRCTTRPVWTAAPQRSTRSTAACTRTTPTLTIWRSQPGPCSPCLRSPQMPPFSAAPTPPYSASSRCGTACWIVTRPCLRHAEELEPGCVIAQPGCCMQASLQGRTLPGPAARSSDGVAPADLQGGDAFGAETRVESGASGGRRWSVAGPAIGGAVGALALLGTALLAAVLWSRRRRQRLRGKDASWPQRPKGAMLAGPPRPVYSDFNHVRAYLPRPVPCSRSARCGGIVTCRAAPSLASRGRAGCCSWRASHRPGWSEHTR